MPSFPQYPLAKLVMAASYTATQTANYTAANGDFVVANPSGGAFNVTLPPVALGGPVGVVNIGGTNAVTLKTSDGSTINGVAGTTGVATGTSVGSSLQVASNGTAWFTVAH